MTRFAKLAPSSARTLKYHPANREIKKNKVNSFFNKLVKGQSDSFPPILVETNTRYVIDGQHRLEAYKKWWESGATEPIWVQYIDRQEEEIYPKIIDMNSSSSAWNSNDYYHGLMRNGNDGAKLLTDFCNGKEMLTRQIRKENRPNIRFASSMLCGKNLSRELKDGTISQCVTPEVVEYGEWTYKTFMTIYNAIGYTRIGSTTWLEDAIKAWYKVIHDPIYSEFIKSIPLEELGAIMAESVTPDTNNDSDGFETRYKAALYAKMKAA